MKSLLTALILVSITIISALNTEIINIDSLFFELELVVQGNPEYVQNLIYGKYDNWWEKVIDKETPDLRIIPESIRGNTIYHIKDPAGKLLFNAPVVYWKIGTGYIFKGNLQLNGETHFIVFRFRFLDLGDGNTRILFTGNVKNKVSDKFAISVTEAWQFFIFDQFRRYIKNK